jgi:hypothetical protein
MSPDEIMKAWMPNGAAWEQFQKMFAGFGGK